MLQAIRAHSDKSNGSGDGGAEVRRATSGSQPWERGGMEGLQFLSLKTYLIIPADSRADDKSGLSKEATQAIEAIEYITRHLTRDNDYKKKCDEWKFVSMVLDRLLLYIFLAATLGGTIGVLFSAPNVFEYVDQAAVIEKLKLAAAAEQNSSILRLRIKQNSSI
ncbi:hypothetical protein COOONC_19377 [Cooperia oncophora]